MLSDGEIQQGMERYGATRGEIISCGHIILADGLNSGAASSTPRSRTKRKGWVSKQNEKLDRLVRTGGVKKRL